MTNPAHPKSLRLLEMRRTLYATGNVTPEYLAYTRDFHLDHRTIQAHAGVFAVVLANFHRDNHCHPIFNFVQDGVPAAVVEAILFNQFREPYVADLVSWPLHDPVNFATALGANDGADVLGAVNMPQRGGKALWVHRTPLDWLMAGCEGCVPLSAAGGRYWLNKAGGPFLVGNLEDGRWLRGMLGPFAARHRILVAMKMEGDAA